jgi:CHAD domain-containing protein
MTPVIKKHESSPEAFHRISRSLLDEMELALAHPGPVEVHEARKLCKWLKSLVHLFRGEIAKGRRALVLRKIRVMAKILSPAREATVALDTLRSVSSRGAFPRFEARLEHRTGMESRRLFAPQARRRAQRVLAQLGRAWPDLSGDHRGWLAIEPGLRRAFRRVRKEHRNLSVSASDEDFHKWRKHVKELGYHLRLHARIGPKWTLRAAKVVDELTDRLGRLHDFGELETLATNSGELGTEPRTALLATLAQAKLRLREKALSDAEELVAMKPAKSLRRIRRAWHRRRK